jgi:hypothetical protein
MTTKNEGLRIGVAAVDITPPAGVKLAGYGVRKGVATGVGHRLRAEALVARGHGGAWALVTSDTVGYPRDLVLRVRQRIAAKTRLPAEAIMLSATHTHSGPAGMRTYDSDLQKVDLEYCRELEERLVRLVVRAAQAAKPGSFEVAWTEAPELASNRRVLRQGGAAVNEWEDPEGRHTGYYDPSVMLVAVRRPNGRRDALLVNYGCHPVTLGPRSLRISADYVGYLKDYLEARGAAGLVLFALAGAGNINPRVCIQVGAEHPRRMGERLGEIVHQATAKLHPVAAGPVAAGRQTWSLISKRDWPAGSGRKKGDVVETELLALRAGDLALVSVPGELFSEYAARLREASPLPETVVVSLANDSVGYLPTDEAMAQGGHEVTHAAADGLEAALLEHAQKALAALAARGSPACP